MFAVATKAVAVVLGTMGFCLLSCIFEPETLSLELGNRRRFRDNVLRTKRLVFQNNNVRELSEDCEQRRENRLERDHE